MGRSADEDVLLDTTETAEMLRLNPKVLARWRKGGRGPRFVQMGRLVYYRRAAIVDYIRSVERAPAAVAGEQAVGR